MPMAAELKPVEFVPAQCPNCSGQLQLPKNRPAVKCMYCGADIAVPSVLRESQSTGNLLELARTAQLAGNQDEAYRYFTKVLESDPCHCEAWLGKGIAAGKQSTLSHLRLSEMCVAIGRAIECVDEGSRAGLIQRAADEAGSLALDVWRVSRHQAQECAAVDGIWDAHIDRSTQALDVLWLAHEWRPTSEAILEGIVHICTQDLTGLTYAADGVGGHWLKGIRKPPPEHMSKFRSVWEVAVANLKRLRPDYQPPQLPPGNDDWANLKLALLAWIGGAIFLWIWFNAM